MPQFLSPATHLAHATDHVSYLFLSLSFYDFYHFTPDPQQIITFVTDFYYDPRQPMPGSNYAPSHFISRQIKLPHNNSIKVIFGKQVDSSDCFVRCGKFIFDCVTGAVDLDSYSSHTHITTSRMYKQKLDR